MIGDACLYSGGRTERLMPPDEVVPDEEDSEVVAVIFPLLGEGVLRARERPVVDAASRQYPWLQIDAGREQEVRLWPIDILSVSDASDFHFPVCVAYLVDNPEIAIPDSVDVLFRRQLLGPNWPGVLRKSPHLTV